MKEVWILCPNKPVTDTQVKIVEKMCRCRLIVVESMPKKATIDCIRGVVLDGVFQEGPVEIDVNERPFFSKGKNLGKIAFLGWQER